MDGERVTPVDRLLGAALIAAPTLLLASTALYTGGGGLSRDVAGGAVQVYAMVAWMLALQGLLRLAGQRLPRAAAWLALIATLGVAGGIGYGVDSMHRAQTGLRAQEIGPLGILAVAVPGILFPLSIIAVGVAIVRAGVVPGWNAALLITGAVLFPASRIAALAPLALLADSLFLIALAPVGWAILSERQHVRVLAGPPTT